MDLSALHPEARRHVEHHGMLAHPEGGFFVETFRSPHTVQPEDGRGARSALTTILFLLDAGHAQGISRLHRVTSDEVWHFIAGDPLELTILPEDLSTIEDGPLDEAHPVRVVPAGHWQAARTLGSWTLVGCTVGPGFDFSDFTMLREAPEHAERFARIHPDRQTLL